MEGYKKLVRCIILSGLLAVISSPAGALTISDLVTRSRLYLRDTATDTSRQRFSNATLIEFFNEAQEEIVDQTWCLQDRVYYDLTASTQEYTVPTDFIKPLGVWISSQAIAEMTIRGELDEGNKNWSLNTSTPTAYYIRRSSSVVVIGFYLTPSTTTTGQVRMDYLKSPATLSSTLDTPLGSGVYDLKPYHRLLALYAAYRGWMINGRPDLAAPYYQQYAAGVVKMKENLGTMPNYRPGMVGGRR